MKIAFYGGTFNPIHNAHLILANEIAEKFSLDLVLFVPDNIPPHKKNPDNVNGLLRYRMVELGIKDNGKFKALDIEIKRGGISYSIDTITELYKMFDVTGKIYFIIGADLVPELNTWHRIEELKDIVNFVVYNRDGKTGEENLKQYPFINPAHGIRMDISSTLIREKVKNNKSIKYLVPEEVKNFIKEKNLYK